MAGSQIAIPANGASDWSDFVTVVERNLRGWMALSLTNMDSASLPAVAAGSALEVGGAVYKFDSEEAITGWSGIAVSTDVWIKVVPSGTSITVVFTTTDPTWSDAKQGYYDSNDRYVAWLRKDAAGTGYLYKHLVPTENVVEMLFEDTIEIGDWNMVSTASVSIAHELEDHIGVRAVEAIIRADSGLPTPFYRMFDGDAGGTIGVDDTNVDLARLTGGSFDSSAFDSTSYNRGWISIRHKVL